MDKTKCCTNCEKEFVFSAREASFLERVSPRIGASSFLIPSSKLCPSCRLQERLSFRNEWHLYKRKCDFSTKSIVAIYPENSPYQVYSPEVWWSDAYDPLEYGRDFDFTKSFFEQFHELNLAVPKLAIQNSQSENSEYTNYSWGNKNCYVCAGTLESEDCYYCYRVTSSKDICDSYDLFNCELCYGCTQSTSLWGSVFSHNCH